MFRPVFGVCCAVLLLACSALVAQFAQNQPPSTAEPPMAEPGEVVPAPASAVVVPGQPRPLPNLDVAPVEPGGSRAPEMADNPSTVQPAQYVLPAPTATTAPAAFPGASRPTVLHPEPLTPVVKISVKGPEIAPTGQEVTYRLTVANSSDARAHNVVARCMVPRGAKLIKSLPEAKGDGKDLEWPLDTLEPGATRLIEVVFKPDDAVTELTVVGKVQFEHGRFVKTRLANPTLQMKKTGPAQGVLDDPLTYKIVVSNPGKVPVADTRIVDTLPEGLEYVRETAHGAILVSQPGPGPNQRTWTIGVVNPGASRTLEYRVMPRKTGDWTSEAIATGAGAKAKAGCNTVIQDARIGVQINGPPGEKATANQATPYLIVVHNTGTAILHNVRVCCNFPQEMRAAKAANSGHLFRDAVQWVLPKLEPNESKELTVSLIAPSAGLREITVSARAHRGLEQRKKLQTVFAGVPALNWQAEGTATAAIGQEIVYTITLKNPGSAPAKNVKLTADLPDQVEFRQAQPAFQRGQGAVFFNALEIPAKESVTLKVTVVAKKAGEARFQFELKCEGMSSGPLKTSKSTAISPGGEPMKIDPTRIGTATPPETNKLDAPAVVPALHVDPAAAKEPMAPAVIPATRVEPPAAKKSAAPAVRPVSPADPPLVLPAP